MLSSLELQKELIKLNILGELDEKLDEIAEELELDEKLEELVKNLMNWMRNLKNLLRT